jgi:hypothetical protein
MKHDHAVDRQSGARWRAAALLMLLVAISNTASLVVSKFVTIH